MQNSLSPYGYRHSRLNLDQRPVKDEAETDSEGEFVSDFTGLTAEEAKVTNAEMNLGGGGEEEGGHAHLGGHRSHGHQPFSDKLTPGGGSADYTEMPDEDDGDEAPTSTAGNQSSYQEFRDQARPTAMEENPESDDLEDLNEDEDSEFYQGAAQQGFTNKTHGSSAASMALSKSQEIVRKFSAGPAAITLAEVKCKRCGASVSEGRVVRMCDDCIKATRGSVNKAAPNVFRDDSPYGGGSRSGRASGDGGGARQQRSPVSRPQVGQSMGGARAGQPRGGMQPKRTMSYAREGDEDQECRRCGTQFEGPVTQGGLCPNCRKGY